MNLRSIKQLKSKDLKDKRVLLRLDLDVPLGDDGKVDAGEDRRLVASLPTVKYLLKQGAHLVIVGHLGRPGGQIVPELKFKPIVQRLAELLNIRTGIALEKIGGFDGYLFLFGNPRKASPRGKQEISVIENIRFWPGEELNSEQLAKDLSKLADVYVNEAFANSHRVHASIVGVTKYLPSYAGLNLVKEAEVLGKVLKRPTRPLTIIIGGIKAETKLKLIEKFIPRADYILLGSGTANNFYKSLGLSIGKSKIDPSLDDLVAGLIKRPQYKILESTDSRILLDPSQLKSLSSKVLKDLKKKIILPMDVVVGEYKDVVKHKKNPAKKVVTIVPNKKLTIHSDQLILDIGPQTIKLYQEIIKRSKTIIWNGPMGLFEQPPFDQGTNEIAKSIAASRGKGIVGGGDTIAALESKHVNLSQNMFISTGGGAMLEFLLEPKMPGIKPLIKK
jgi:3-phosphoglycerate kinase